MSSELLRQKESMGIAREGLRNDEEKADGFGKFLIDCRGRLDLNVRDAAAAANISPVYLRRLEKDEVKNPSIPVAYGLSQAYGISVDSLAERLMADQNRQLIDDISRLESLKPFKFERQDWSTLSLRDKQLYLEFLKTIASEEKHLDE